MPAFSMQKQSSRNLILSPNSQIAYGGVLADAKFTTRQRFDPSTVFEHDATFRSDNAASGKGSEWATDSQITSWDGKGTIKAEADAFLMGWMMALTFGQEVVTGAGPYTHTFSVPNITATMPCTTLYVEETNDVKFKLPDMAAAKLSLTVPERGSISASLDMVGTGRRIAGAMVAALPALVPAIYLLGSDFVATITPAAGDAVPFSGRQKSLSITLDRGSSAFKASGDGLTAGSVASGAGKFSVDLTVAAEATDDVNGWFESQTALAITLATNPALTYQMGFTFPLAYAKANKLGNTEDKVMWALQFDETTCLQSGAQAAISGFVINDTAAYLTPA